MHVLASSPCRLSRQGKERLYVHYQENMVSQFLPKTAVQRTENKFKVYMPDSSYQNPPDTIAIQ